MISSVSFISFILIEVITPIQFKIIFQAINMKANLRIMDEYIKY